MAAAEALGGIELPEATSRLERLLSDGEPQMVAVAARALRRHGYAGAVQHLANLLSHADQGVRAVARSGLGDFTFLRYVAQFDQMDGRMRTELGNIVRESDLTAIDQLAREIAAATLPRKLRGLQMATAMNAVDDLLDLVAAQGRHPDAAVRSEAVLALSMATNPSVEGEIEAATRDANVLVRNRAKELLREFTGRQSASGEVPE